MGAPPVPRALFRDFTGDDTYDSFVRAALLDGTASGGHHNQNFVHPLTRRMADRLPGQEAGTPVTVRIRRFEALPVVIRTWRDEAELLDGIGRVLPHVPRCLARRGRSAIHSYVEGVPLKSVCPNGKPLDSLLVRALAELLAQMSRVGKEHLPSLPGCWPQDSRDSQGFLRTLAHLADRQIRGPNWAEFGGLFAALGVSGDAMTEFARRVPAMARRPYSLLHADLHRDNVIVSYGIDPPLICVDWELATYGDPLHDLATHLVRMRYPDFQWDEVIHAWVDSVEAVRPAAVKGLATDLRHYIAFERAQSVFPDVMRAAKSLDGSPDQKTLDAATAEVRRALVVAAEPLMLPHVPDEDEIERLLLRRQAGGRTTARDARPVPVMHWRPDDRMPEHPDFPRSAVLGALLAEAVVPAERVLKGTAHVNSVVHVRGFRGPVVVRRKLASVRRTESRFLSEHAVLRAIERSGLPVQVPRVLALGESLYGSSRAGDPFAIHTYVGPLDGDHPPNHPVHGLLPHEADGLVDQLCALTDLDYLELDPLGADLGFCFCDWLTEQLVDLVRKLPKGSLQTARQLGLPDPDRLHQILSRHHVTARQPALLHGDLNPWNLVRRDDRFGLTLIDWERAMVGDPLYDLVRHMHLTPTRPEIRVRMFRRWANRLPVVYTRAWEEDWHVYRWLEIVRSAYVDLDRLLARADLDAPNVNRAVDSYGTTLDTAMASLGLPPLRTANPYLARALPHGDHGGG
ncbi:aminoglycoside phosphotransferase family protein [Streptomyces sp. NBC_00203]|uniref:aminoglycoside phosphotransferase family protein n=1 Tax=Streptomyces sp. NBC_00203 TaxID=2975680 RepID=UPI0038659706